MNEESKILKSEITNLRRTKTLTVDNKHIELEKFSTLQKGYGFEKGTQWQIQNTNMYLISADKPYILHGYDGSPDFWSRFSSSKHIFCYLELNRHFPDTIIRPTEISSKLVNLFTHFAIKIPGQSVFSHKYMVETINEAEALELLNSNLTDLISKTDELTIDIRDNKCLLHYSHAVREGDVEMLLEIAEMLLQ